MGKHKIFEELPKAKRRRQSIIPEESTNPKGKDGLAQCFSIATATMYVSIAPAFIQTPLEGIRSQYLDQLVLRYYSPVNGVVISYNNIELLGQDEVGGGAKVAKIINESPYAFLWISVDFLVWNPAIGDPLEGYVSAQSPGHIALLIHDTFNATIRRDDIPSNWEFVYGEQDDGAQGSGSWYDGNGNKIDTKLRFTVKYFDTQGRTVLVLGSLLTLEDVQRELQPAKQSVDTPTPLGQTDEPSDEHDNTTKEEDSSVPKYASSSSDSDSESDSDSDSDSE